MFTQVHSNTINENKKNAIYMHLYDCNIRQLIKENKIITDTWKAICREDAKQSVSEIVRCGNLDSYYNRLQSNAV